MEKLTLKNNVKKIYDYQNNQSEKDDWLDGFEAVQLILTNKTKVDTQLEVLNQLMVTKNLSLTEVLAESEEKGGWSTKRIRLTDFVPPETFLDLVSNGNLFQDLVAKRHGSQTHRIQWFIIRKELGNKKALALFKEAGNPGWNNDSKYMWDYIVDITGGMGEFDFRQPEKLEAYLNETFTTDSAEENVIQEQNKMHNNNHSQLKTDFFNRHPSKSNFTSTMLEEEEQCNAMLKNPSNIKLQRKRLEIAPKMKDEKVVNETTINKLYLKIEWTGWIHPLDSNNPEEAQTFLVPTVARILEERHQQGCIIL